jgi:ELWxxDGT repeat protein
MTSRPRARGLARRALISFVVAPLALAGAIAPAHAAGPTMSSDPRYLTKVGSTLYFSADDGSAGRELWKSNGTASGTKRVRNIRPGNNGSSHD